MVIFTIIVKITIRTYKIDQIQVKYLLNTIPRQHAHTEIGNPTTDQRQYIYDEKFQYIYSKNIAFFEL